MSDVVDRAFDRLEKSLPTYVSPVAAHVVSLAIAIAAGVLLWPHVQDERNKEEQEKADGKDEKKTLFQRHRSLAMATGVVVLCLVLQSVLFSRVYYLLLLRKNRQHFANVFWLERYASSLAASRSSLM